MTDQHAEKPPLLWRVWEAIVGEFTPPPMPRPTPSEEEFAEGYLAVGMINDAIEDGPGGDVQGPDKLVISADIPAWFHPGIALAASVAAVPLGVFLVAVCNVRRESVLSRQTSQEVR